MPSIRVSVVMAARNADRTILEAMCSVLDQTMAELELIVCDDASTDGTSDLLASVDDSRLRVIRNETNIGAGPSRDRAIATARGTWLAVIDADDAWEPQRLERLLAVAGDGHAFVFDNLMQCHDTDHGMAPWRTLRSPSAFGGDGRTVVDVAFAEFVAQDRLLVKPLLPTELVRRHAITHPAMRFGEDTAFFLRVLATGLPLRYVPDAMYLYRLTPQSATTHPHKHRLMREAVESILATVSLDADARQALSRKVARLARSEQYEAFRASVHSGRITEVLASIRQRPWMLGWLLRKTWSDAGYRLHRLAHSARGRDSR